ncbi:MAG: mltG [Paenibacillaceae bacterium]|nr:mltG [Paenibacillaceae bacterium]
MDEQVENQHTVKKRSRWKIALAVAASVVFVVLAAGGAAVYYAYRSLQPLAAGESKEIVIPAGTGSAGIADILEQEGIIRNKLAYTMYLRYQQQGDRFQAGRYEMKPGMTLDEITDKMNQGDVIKEEMMRYTIPEGFTVVQIAEKLAAEGLIDKDAFLALANEEKEWPVAWTGTIPKDGNLRSRLEGYMFPETYEMKKGSTEQDILLRMLSEWDKKKEQLAGWEQALAERKLTLHEVLTVASLIEREVVVDEERPVVAGVIYNRLDKKMPLQIDATIQYLFDKPKERLFEKDLQIESPYNTYLHTGLPPGPIANPGLASIKAALWPATTQYFFYVTKKDGTGAHLFAETFEEHKKNNANSKAGK